MPNLDTIPPELLSLICLHLSPKFIVSNFVLVCKKFHSLFGNEEYWRSRLLRVDPTLSFPVTAVSSPSFRWDRICETVELEQRRWKNKDRYFRHATLSGGHIAVVDAVHLTQAGRLCVSGSRDRLVCLWDLSRLSDSTENANAASSNDQIYRQYKGHEGWVWAITSLDDSVYTGSWDQRILHWQLTQTDLRQLSSINCSAAVLCIVAERNTIIASTFYRHVHLFDVREPHCKTMQTNYHTRPVLGLATDDEERFIYTCSEDKSVVCFDRRAAAVLHRLELDDYGVAISSGDGQIWVGSKEGTLHLLDPSWTHLTTYDVGAGQFLSDVKHNAGCMIAAYYDMKSRVGSCRVATSGLRPHSLAEVDFAGQQPTKIHYSNGILACGSADSNVHLWLPADN